jgi:hypothetical protein
VEAELQLRDLRHEAGSRFDEAGVPTNYVEQDSRSYESDQTSRYLNINTRGLHRAIEAHKAVNKATAQPLPNGSDSTPADVQRTDGGR